MRAQSAAVQVGSIRAALSRTLIEEVRFATDSSLEGAGFEPSVPRSDAASYETAELTFRLCPPKR
jgi:hypothetical protein